MSQSHVYFVSHHSHAKLQRPSRTNPARSPADGPSPCSEGPKTSEMARVGTTTRSFNTMGP